MHRVFCGIFECRYIECKCNSFDEEYRKVCLSKDILTAISFVTSVMAVDIVVAEEVLIDTDAIVAG